MRGICLPGLRREPFLLVLETPAFAAGRCDSAGPTWHPPLNAAPITGHSPVHTHKVTDAHMTAGVARRRTEKKQATRSGEMQSCCLSRTFAAPLPLLFSLIMLTLRLPVSQSFPLFYSANGSALLTSLPNTDVVLQPGTGGASLRLQSPRRWHGRAWLTPCARRPQVS